MDDSTIANQPTGEIEFPSLEMLTDTEAQGDFVLIDPSYQAGSDGDDALLETEPITVQSAPTLGFAISLEFVAYVAFAVIALTLRLVQLGTVVLSDAEAREALAVFRTMGTPTAGVIPISSHPLMFAVNSILMGVLGTASAIPRLGTVFASIVVILMPILFRRWIGKPGALILSGVLAFSPVLLASSRGMAGAVWSILLALIAIYCIGRFHETKARHFAWIGTVSIGLLLVGAESAGFLVAIMAGAGFIFAIATADAADQGLRNALQTSLGAFPWVSSLIVTALSLALVGTVFFLKIDGAAGFGEVINRGLNGFLFRLPQNPLAFPLYTSLIYEPVLWIFGLFGAWYTLREEGDFLRRIFLGWLVVAVIGCLIYPGALAEHALWLTLPLAMLSTLSIEKVLSPVRDRFWNVPIWGPYLHSVGVVACLSITGINLISIGRTVLTLPASLTPSLELPRVMLTVLTIALLVILFFLVGSIWGSRAAWRGLGIGVLAFLGVYSFASGLRATVNGIDDAREPWHPRPTSQNLARLESDLKEISLRASGTVYDMPLTVVWPDNGAVAWTIRDFKKVSYVETSSPLFNGPAILLPRTGSDPKAEKPQLGAAYVGTDYPVYYTFNRESIQYWDVLSWIYIRDTREKPISGERVALWVRGDVYGALTTEPSGK